jgi:uncharacterized phage protein gp47/JayE
MAFVRPTLAELVTRVTADFVSRLAPAGTLLRKSMVLVLARVIAGATHMLHGNLAYVANQLFADTADFTFLVRIGTLFGVPPKAATFATGNITATGTNGSTIPIHTLLQRSDGTEYQTTAGATISSGSAVIPVTALLAATSGNCDTGTQLNFESPVSGVNSAVTCSDADGLTGGNDPETVDNYRPRVLERLQLPPQGGADADYVEWATTVPGVTRAFVYPGEQGLGTVVVRFLTDHPDGSDPTPDSPTITAVQDYLNTVRPVTADVVVIGPVANPVNFILQVTPNTSDVKNACTAQLKDLLAQGQAAPGATIFIWQVRQAIGGTPGLTNYNITEPLGDIAQTTNQWAELGTVTYT